jgi:hypothetical protein
MKKDTEEIIQCWIRNDFFRTRIRIYSICQVILSGSGSYLFQIITFDTTPIPEEGGGFVSQKWNLVLFSFLAAWSRDSEQAAESAHQQGKPSSQHTLFILDLKLLFVHFNLKL